ETSPSKAKDWSAGTYTAEQTAVKDGVLYRVKPSVSSTTGEPGVSSDWEPIGKNVEVIDNVNSESTIEALSARQGKLLNDNIQELGLDMASLTEIDITLSTGNRVISPSGEESVLGAHSILYVSVTEGDRHKVVSQLTTTQ